MNSFDLLSLINPFRTKPFTLTLAVTYRCPKKCLICNIWKIYSRSPKKARAELPVKDYRPLFKNLKNDLVYLTITGGEPFVRPDLDQLVGLAANNLKRLAWITITTSGFSAPKIRQTVRKILSIFPKILSLEIGLDGPPEIHDKIRGVKGSFGEAVKTYQALKALAVNQQNLRPYFSYTISQFNAGNFARFARILKKQTGIGVAQIGISLEHSGHLYQRPEPVVYSSPFRKKVAADLSYLAKNNHFDLSSDIFFFGKKLFRRFYLKQLPNFLTHPQKQILPCQAARSSCFVDPYGHLYPCIIWNQPLGNISSLSWGRFLLSPKRQKICQKIRQQTCPVCFTPCEVQTAFLGRLFWSLPKII